MKRTTKPEKSKQEETNKLNKLKEEISKSENDIKMKKNECVRIITDYDIELKFLNAKIQYQTDTDQNELQMLNDKMREYKEQIKYLNEQINKLNDNALSPSFIQLKEDESELEKEIEKLKKEKLEKELQKKENKKSVREIDRNYETVENEKFKISQEIQNTKQCVMKLENLKFIHFTVHGTVAVFGNQYIDFADENNIVLNGLNDDPGTYCSLFLGIVYFSQSFCFWVLGQFSYWQYKQILNIIVQIFIGAICLALIYLRNGWVLCVLAIPIGIISGYDLQSNVLYSINAGPKIKGVILGMSECVGELTCCLCPLFAGLIATQTDDRKWALWFGLILQCVGIVLCIITQAITIILERFDKQKESDEIELGNEHQESNPIEDVDVDTNLVHQIEIEDGNVSESSELDKEEDSDEKSPEENENVQPTGTPEQKPSNE
ncbi:hypothetical protein EDI_071010 [Entamoeba dispar SAW760]|uniref:Uncharacterized protein n=1 Tax=Entamoeba dispar (strain ATCC PRA-260 / SAW760) TaxID=370354 RepID=B0EME1_ENTDS|nr:uncharacterized protein EDI_071010 [Entamoeba dispar SAW760]EDR24359.1 hypothetical protein EDI_071010 [Entamoeba dispar SAW760]|eukprot:EDR24359.1 hypothetical protein EDI_071010 [Entamoeba dispar SAW760]